MSAKVFVVMQQDLSTAHPLAVFKKEGEAEQSADAHRDINKRVWVEEINYYE